MRRILLISNSTSFGSGYLDHCQDEIERFLGPSVGQITFVPYALPEMTGYAYKVNGRFRKMGYGTVSLHDIEEAAAVLEESEALFIGGGNTFLLLKRLYDKEVMDVIRRRVGRGMPYIGTSAGSNVACISIRTTNDMPIAYPPSFDGLGIVPFNINPHYIDPDPDSTHKGETRVQRIQQFHEMNDPYVVGLREGSMLLVEGDVMTLKGPTGAKLFSRGDDPKEFSEGADLSFLLR
ncbi:MAG: dipeptidase PepE [Thermoplasmatota archaeon]